MTMTLDDTVVDLADGIYSGQSTAPAMARLTIAAITASAIPVKPPREWFTDPGLSEITPLTIESSGRVFGHVAGWKQDHIGMNGRIRAPHSKSGYAFFATGCLECDTGEMVNVGQISLVGGHASLEASVAEAVAHYDNTDSGMMDVAVGEDRHGIWVAGALRPDVDELRLRKLRASGVSGDWRPINGSLEMVAVCSVNVPGFPIPRARVAAGVPVAMVAAGTTEIVEALLADHAAENEQAVVAAALTSLDDRVRMMEGLFLDRVIDRREAILAAVAEVVEAVEEIPAPGVDELAALRARVYGVESAQHVESPVESVPESPGPEPGLLAPVTVDLDSLRARVRGVPTEMVETVEAPLLEVIDGGLEEELVPEEDPIAVMAALRQRVGTWVDGMPLEYSFAECQLASAQSLQASLRARVKGGLVAAPKSWSADERRKAKGKGQTMPDGSFPTVTKSDWYRGRQSVGRAKNPAAAKRYLKRRARTLGIPRADYASL